MGKPVVIDLIKYIARSHFTTQRVFTQKAAAKREILVLQDLVVFLYQERSYCYHLEVVPTPPESTEHHTMFSFIRRNASLR